MTGKRIFCFNNGGSPGWMSAQALSEDGYFLAGHICSAEGFMHHDLGITSNWKHENYDAHFGKGNWELIWVPTEQVKAHSHAGLNAAIEKHRGLTEAEFIAHKEKIDAGIALARSTSKGDEVTEKLPAQPSIRWRALHNRVLVVAAIDLGVQWAAYVVPVPGEDHRNEAIALWRSEGNKLEEELARQIFPDLVEIEYRD